MRWTGSAESVRPINYNRASVPLSMSGHRFALYAFAVHRITSHQALSLKFLHRRSSTTDRKFGNTRAL